MRLYCIGQSLTQFRLLALLQIQRKLSVRLVIYLVFLLLITTLGIMESTRDKFAARFMEDDMKSLLVCR